MAGENVQPAPANEPMPPPPPGAAPESRPRTVHNDPRVALFQEALMHAANLAQAFAICPNQPLVMQNQAVRITVEGASLVIPVGSVGNIATPGGR